MGGGGGFMHILTLHERENYNDSFKVETIEPNCTCVYNMILSLNRENSVILDPMKTRET